MIEERLQALYAKIPEVPSCIQGCTKCCGQVAMLPVEAKKLGLDYCATPINEDLKCTFSLNGGCDVYENRPFTCRMFNVADDGCWLTCPIMNNHGPMTQATSDELYAEWFSILEDHSDEDKERFEKAWAKSEVNIKALDARNGWVK